MIKKILNTCEEKLIEEKSNAKFSSILIKNNKEFYFNFHDNEQLLIYSFLFDKEGNLKNVEKIKEDFRPLKEEDEIKEEEIKKIEEALNEAKNKELKDFIITKKEGRLNLVEFDLKEQKITEYEINNEGKIKKKEFKFNDIFKMQ
ncbi:MAG: hypothetical protein ABGW69_00300 [Nanoarchaeota archaeon]